MRREFFAVLLLLVFCASIAAQQTIYFKKDHIYGAGGKEIAVLMPLPVDQMAPSAPTNLSTSQISSTSVALSWLGSTDSGGSLLAGYKVYRQKTPVASNANLPVTVLGTGTTTFVDQPLAPHTQYQYSIVAYDQAQNHSAPSAAVLVTTLFDTIPPSAPTNLSSQSITHRKVRLDWIASTDTGGSGVAGYRVYRGGSLISGGSLVTSLWYEDTTVSPGTNYSYTLTAIDNDNNVSALSAASSVTTFWLKDDFNQPNANALNAADWTNWTYTGHPAYVWKIESNRASTPQTAEDIWVNSVANAGSLGGFKATVSIFPNSYDGLVFWGSPSGGRYRAIFSGGVVSLLYYASANADLSGYAGGSVLASASASGSTLKVEANSSTRTIKIYIDGVLKITFTETNTSRPNTGSVGITAWQPGPYLLDPCDPNSIVYPPLSQADDFLLEVYP